MKTAFQEKLTQTMSNEVEKESSGDMHSAEQGPVVISHLENSYTETIEVIVQIT